MFVASTTLKNLPTLGVGFGFREPYRADLFLHRDQIDFLEITADHYLEATPEKVAELQLLADHFTLIPHGLNLSLGSAEGLDSEYRDALVELTRKLNPPWWSEHIAFTRGGGVEIGHLAPVPFTEEAVDVLVANINEVQALIDIPFIVENITQDYRIPGTHTLEEADFLRAIVERTGCGLLLDVTNLYTNHRNHGDDLERFLDRLPGESVVQLHFAGGHEERGKLIDSHSSATPEEVWTLLERVVERFPVKGIILERDEDLPPFSEILKETDRARAVARRHGRCPSPTIKSS